MDLAEFLRARLEEDEQVARDVGPDGGPDTYRLAAIDDDNGRTSVDIASERVLAEVEAKRRIMARHKLPEQADWPEMRIIGAVYADHPDYRPEWKPSA